MSPTQSMVQQQCLPIYPTRLWPLFASVTAGMSLWHALTQGRGLGNQLEELVSGVFVPWKLKAIYGVPCMLHIKWQRYEMFEFLHDPKKDEWNFNVISICAYRYQIRPYSQQDWFKFCQIFSIFQWNDNNDNDNDNDNNNNDNDNTITDNYN